MYEKVKIHCSISTLWLKWNSLVDECEEPMNDNIDIWQIPYCHRWSQISLFFPVSVLNDTHNLWTEYKDKIFFYNPRQVLCVYFHLYQSYSSFHLITCEKCPSKHPIIAHCLPDTNGQIRSQNCLTASAIYLKSLSK